MLLQPLDQFRTTILNFPRVDTPGPLHGAPAFSQVRFHNQQILNLCVHCVTRVTVPNKKHLKKNVGPIRHCEPPHAHLPAVATDAACASMSTTTTTTTRDRGDRYGPMEWAQMGLPMHQPCHSHC